MAELDLIIFDDAMARSWYPFSLTRPAGELLLGTMTLRERAERVTRTACAGHVCSTDLAGFDEAGAPPALDPAKLAAGRARLFLSSRCVLPWDAQLDLTHEATLSVADQIAGWLLPPGAAAPLPDEILVPGKARGSVQTVGGVMLEKVWDLIERNHDYVAADALHFQPSNEPTSRLANAQTFGDYPLMCGAAVSIEPGTVFDLSAGPVWLDDRVSVRAFSRIAGPTYVGKGSTLLGGSYTASSIGPACKVHGEIEASVLLGFSNKAHDGFLGHAYVGQWVNLGAFTTNSDLKNNYSNVRVWTPAGEVDTGLMKLGSLIGDHVKTAIGTLLNTGTVIGPGCNIIGGMPPKHVASFSWGDGEYALDKFLEAAQLAMQRRQVVLSAQQRELLARAWYRTRGRPGEQ
jgi:UDP-N-acetylglucosamine diphosphorylase/glucosamine-1-phosphate N-acetyltransferase